jgi:hypothetical protein
MRPSESAQASMGAVRPGGRGGRDIDPGRLRTGTGGLPPCCRHAGRRWPVVARQPSIYPALSLTATVGRPMDQIAGGVDGRGLANRRAPEWVLAQLLTANRAARRHDRRRLGAGRRGQSGPPRAGHAGRRHDLSGDVTDATPDEIRAMTVVATTVVGRVAACGDTALCAED